MADRITLVSRDGGARVDVPTTDRGEINRLKSLGYTVWEPTPAVSATEDYTEHTNAQLREEIARRNADRDEATQIDVDSKATKPELAAALEADDKNQEPTE